ncbi:uncharacterized protein LOC142635058 [Castanea sativa]|uniref:uncharacterized protein LOC142635058 n=1 Tax=Castanea sativa TaxID=21020 RepID=UPI003F64DEA6
MFNEIDGDFDGMAIRTFKVGLPAEHSLRKSLMGKSISDVHQLMDRIDKYKWVKEDQQLGKGKVKVVSQDRKDFRSNKGQIGSGSQRDASSKPPLDTINVILVTLGMVSSHHFRVLSIAQPPVETSYPKPKRSRMEVQPALSFSENDKASTLQPHDDALVVTLRIRGFDEKVVIPKGQIKIPVQAWSEVVEMKYPSSDQVEELIGGQFMARQCLVNAIRHQAKGESSASNEQSL